MQLQEREREKFWESRRAEKYEGGEQIERIKIKCTSWGDVTGSY